MKGLLKLGSLELKNPLMNASGVCSLLPLLKVWEEAGVGAVVPKSIGIEECFGLKNPSVIEMYHGVILNAMGLPGPGYKAFREEMKEYKFNVPVIVSIHGKDESEFAFLARELDSVSDAYELNVSCPNVSGYIIGYETDLLKKVLQETRKATDRPISVKLPYYSADRRKLETVVEIIEECGMDWITEINTLRAMDYSVFFRKPILGGKIGGQSGPSIHGCALAQVYKTRELTDLPIVGVGGIVKAEDVKRFFGVGANAVQLGSGLLYHHGDKYDKKGGRDIKHFVKTVIDGLE